MKDDKIDIIESTMTRQFSSLDRKLTAIENKVHNIHLNCATTSVKLESTNEKLEVYNKLLQDHIHRTNLLERWTRDAWKRHLKVVAIIVPIVTGIISALSYFM